MNIREYQYQLISLFKTDPEAFRAEVKKYEKLLGQKFDIDIAPHYYSGNIDTAKYLSITLNPVTSNFSYYQSEKMTSMSESEVYDYCKNWFALNEGKVKTFTFTRVNKMIDAIEGLNAGGKFKALHKQAAILDLVPFFSKTTSFKSFDITSGLGKDIWDRVYSLSLSQHIEAVFLIGGIFNFLFDSINDEVEKEAQTSILTSKAKSIYQTVKLRKKGKFYHLSHAASARGMNDKIFTEFIPENL